MRVKGATVQKFLLGMALLSALVWNLAHASEIKGLALGEGPTGTRAEVLLKMREVQRDADDGLVASRRLMPSGRSAAHCRTASGFESVRQRATT